MHVFCSEYGWLPSDFLDLTRRQFKALLKGREIWLRRTNEISSEDKAPTAKDLGIDYDRDTGKAEFGDGKSLSKAIQDGAKSGTVRPDNMSGVIDGLVQSKSVKTRVWRGGVKRKDRPKSKEALLAKLKEEMKQHQQLYGHK
tara:strand:- start:31 stop:456 length:426 start_codon:yes stop_codon:yes gene_type:complete